MTCQLARVPCYLSQCNEWYQASVRISLGHPSSSARTGRAEQLLRLGLYLIESHDSSVTTWPSTIRKGHHSQADLEGFLWPLCPAAAARSARGMDCRPARDSCALKAGGRARGLGCVHAWRPPTPLLSLLLGKAIFTRPLPCSGTFLHFLFLLVSGGRCCPSQLLTMQSRRG